jgi:histidine ammonia-lyase
VGLTVVLTGDRLTLDEVVRVARGGERVELAAEATARLREGRALVERTVERGAPVYGLSTGVGARKKVAVAREELPAFNRAMIANHRVGTGPDAPEEVVRATMLRLANGWARGTAGVRPELAEHLVAALNEGELPRVRLLGSVGQADLPALADLAHGLFADAELQAKEGLALLNSNAFSTALAALALADVERLLDALDVAAALELEAFAANLTLLHPAVAEGRPYPGLRFALERLRALLEGSSLWEAGAARNLQDPLTFRCLPQVHGAARDALAFARAQLEIELNASQENPLLLLAEDRIVSVGNFDVLPLAAALDFLRIAIAPALTSACERTEKLLQEPLTGLPDGLAPRQGLAENSLAELGVAAQALTAEARLLAQPVSFELVTSTHAEGIEDRMTMAPLAARRLAEMVALAERLLAIELVIASQAIDLRRPARLGAATEKAHGLVRGRIPFMDEGEPLPQDLEPLHEILGEISALAATPGRSP